MLGIPDSIYWTVESGFRIPIVSGILCSLNLILDFQSPGFWSPKATISLIPETGLPHLGWLLRQKLVIFLKQLFAMLSVLLPKKKPCGVLVVLGFKVMLHSNWIYESSIFILKVISNNFLHLFLWSPILLQMHTYIAVFMLTAVPEEILKWNDSNESYWAVVSLWTGHYKVKGVAKLVVAVG